MSRARNLAGFASAVTNPENGVNISVGVLTAIEYYGDGSNLTGTPGGLGTSLLPDDLSSPLNKIYYTNSNLTIGSTITVDPPSSASAAYTQYQNIVLQGDADLIVGDGDDFIPDILGIGTDVDTPGILGNGEGKVRVDNITDKSGVKAPKFPYGLAVPVGAAVSVGYGTEATPGIVGVDTTTGIFFPEEKEVAIAIGGTERVVVDHQGRVGLGTTNPGSELDLVNTGFANIRFFSGRTTGTQGAGGIGFGTFKSDGSKNVVGAVNCNVDGTLRLKTKNPGQGSTQDRLTISPGGNVNVATGSTLQLGDDSITQNDVYRYEEIAGGAIKKYYVRDTLNGSQSTRFTFSGTDRTGAMITINAVGSWTASNTASNHVAAQFMGRAFTNNDEDTSFAGLTAVFATTYDTNDVTFTNSGSNVYTIDVANPTGDDGVSFFYEIILHNAVPSSQHSMTASSTV